MRNRLTKRWVVTVTVAGIIGAGTAVGFVSTAGATSSTNTRTSRTDSGAVTTAAFTFSVSLSALTSSSVTVTGSGQVDFSDDSASVTANLPPAVSKMLPGGSDSSETVNAVLSGNTVYIEIPSLTSLVGKPWISVALPSKATARISGAFSKVATGLGDVTALVAFAEAHHATATTLGSATIDGVEATGTKLQAAGSLKGMSGTITADIWANAADQLVQATVSASAKIHTKSIGLNATANFTGYDSPVTITVPPPSEVRSIPLSTIEAFLGNGHSHHALL